MDKQILIEHIANGLSQRQIAKEMETGQTAVRYWLKKYQLKTKKLQFNKIAEPKPDVSCKQCGKLIFYRNTFCHNTCMAAFHTSRKFHLIETKGVESISNSESGQRQILKKYLIHKHGEKCMKCGWDKENKHTGIIPIQIDHIDGDPHNQSLDNLRLLCPNCHSLTEFYGRRGKGRKQRTR